MREENGKTWITSAELQAKTNISRATMNNYIKMGIIPRPVIKKPDEKQIKAKRIGYFHDSALGAINLVKLYKNQGLSMKEIKERFLGEIDRSENRQDQLSRNNKNQSGNEYPSDLEETVRSAVPSFVNVAVLSTCLDDSAKIRAELPGDVYLSILIRLRGIVQEVCQNYTRPIRQNSSDKLLWYFVKDRDDGYLANALACAAKIKQRVVDMNRQMKSDQLLLNDIFLNIGIFEGQEHLVVVASPVADEILTAGITGSYAELLCEAGRRGSVLVSKDFINKLDEIQRQRLRYGIRKHIDDSTITIQNTFSRIKDLSFLDKDRYERLEEIQNVAVAEILDFGEEPTNRSKG